MLSKQNKNSILRVKERSFSDVNIHDFIMQKNEGLLGLLCDNSDYVTFYSAESGAEMLESDDKRQLFNGQEFRSSYCELSENLRSKIIIKLLKPLFSFRFESVKRNDLNTKNLWSLIANHYLSKRDEDGLLDFLKNYKYQQAIFSPNGLLFLIRCDSNTFSYLYDKWSMADNTNMAELGRVMDQLSASGCNSTPIVSFFKGSSPYSFPHSKNLKKLLFLLACNFSAVSNACNYVVATYTNFLKDLSTSIEFTQDIRPTAKDISNLYDLLFAYFNSLEKKCQVQINLLLDVFIKIDRNYYIVENELFKPLIFPNIHDVNVMANTLIKHNPEFFEKYCNFMLKYGALASIDIEAENIQTLLGANDHLEFKCFSVVSYVIENFVLGKLKLIGDTKLLCSTAIKALCTNIGNRYFCEEKVRKLLTKLGAKDIDLAPYEEKKKEYNSEEQRNKRLNKLLELSDTTISCFDFMLYLQEATKSKTEKESFSKLINEKYTTILAKICKFFYGIKLEEGTVPEVPIFLLALIKNNYYGAFVSKLLDHNKTEQTKKISVPASMLLIAISFKKILKNALKKSVEIKGVSSPLHRDFDFCNESDFSFISTAYLSLDSYFDLLERILPEAFKWQIKERGALLIHPDELNESFTTEHGNNSSKIWRDTTPHIFIKPTEKLLLTLLKDRPVPYKFIEHLLVYCDQSFNYNNLYVYLRQNCQAILAKNSNTKIGSNDILLINELTELCGLWEKVLVDNQGWSIFKNDRKLDIKNATILSDVLSLLDNTFNLLNLMDKHECLRQKYINLLHRALEREGATGKELLRTCLEKTLSKTEYVPVLISLINSIGKHLDGGAENFLMQYLNNFRSEGGSPSNILSILELLNYDALALYNFAKIEIQLEQPSEEIINYVIVKLKELVEPEIRFLMDTENELLLLAKDVCNSNCYGLSNAAWCSIVEKALDEITFSDSDTVRLIWGTISSKKELKEHLRTSKSFILKLFGCAETCKLVNIMNDIVSTKQPWSEKYTVEFSNLRKKILFTNESQTTKQEISQQYGFVFTKPNSQRPYVPSASNSVTPSQRFSKGKF